MRSGSLACFWAVSLSLLSAVVTNEYTQPVADTQYGKLLGTVLHSDYSPNQIYAFLGVPYAKPPVGDLRLAPAEPMEPWEGERSATEPGNSCSQNSEAILENFKPVMWPRFNISEDCLYLDVYTPNVSGKRDVLFNIHGGGFQIGNSYLGDGTALVSLGDIVLVSFNYRLNLFGFLPNYAGNWPSNLGVRDQQFALGWVQENIAAFGGDPDRVTIAGQSAGSISVSAHILSPSSQGLFHRAIMQSGSALYFDRDAEAPTYAALQTLGCEDMDADATLTCLRSKSVEEMLEAPLPPVQKDGEIFFEDSLERLSDGRMAKVDLLVGVAGDEGYLFTGSFFVPEVTSPDPDPETVEEQILAYLAMTHQYNLAEIHGEVMQHYFDGHLADMEPDQIYQTVAKLIGDHLLTALTYLAAQYHSDHVSNTFFYEFEYQASFMGEYRPDWHTKCDHGFDMIFTHGDIMVGTLLEQGTEVSDEDIAVSNVSVNYWANFIKTGNPNGDGLQDWKRFTREGGNYLILKTECEQASGFYPEDMEFWNTRIRALDQTSGCEQLYSQTIMLSVMLMLKLLTA